MCDLPPLVPDTNDVKSSQLTSKFSRSSSNKWSGTERRRDKEVISKRLLKKAKDRTRSRKYYQRQQSTFENLRREVENLTSKLAQKHRIKAENEAQLLVSWRLMANWQRGARLNAEVHQQRLCAAIDEQTTRIHEFQTFLNSQIRVQRNLVVSEGQHFTNNLYAHMKPLLALYDTDIFDIYVQELDMIHAQIDMALHNFEFAYTMEGSNTTKTSWKEERKTGHFVYLDEQVIPSEFEKACNSLWQLTSLTHRQESRHQRFDIADPENTVAIKFRISTRLNSGRIASVFEHIVTRRYQERGRMVLVWRSLTEGEGMFAGMNAEETGWCVATPIEGSTDTLLRTCVRHTPMHFRGVVANTPEVKQFTSLVLDTGTNDVFETTNKLEELCLK
ncbi:hypothetical protein PHMEG_0007736 [Phytophthora megakarya]|uniref:M96 mating-specific protein n=1 Tax=Phytophthora megakarya TaxID=4795 RepID=A0A225WM49_9STRA|nr:hypothetical protein PHMEG_0007736 [Phytophthora megakarya]